MYLTSNRSVTLFFFFNDTATTEIYTLSLHDALPISCAEQRSRLPERGGPGIAAFGKRSEEHTSELQSLRHLVCRLLLEKKKQRLQTEHFFATRPGKFQHETVYLPTVHE